MDKFIEKISSYNILNNILPGTIMVYLIKWIYQIELSANNLVENLFLYYFVGMVVSRVGSVIIEPIAKKAKLVKYAPYDEFISASKKDEKINILLETNNIYRTFLAVLFISLLLLFHSYILIDKLKMSNETSTTIIFLALLILFASAYRKQTQYIYNRIKKVNNEEG